MTRGVAGGLTRHAVHRVEDVRDARAAAGFADRVAVSAQLEGFGLKQGDRWRSGAPYCCKNSAEGVPKSVTAASLSATSAASAAEPLEEHRRYGGRGDIAGDGGARE